MKIIKRIIISIIIVFFIRIFFELLITEKSKIFYIIALLTLFVLLIYQWKDFLNKKDKIKNNSKSDNKKETAKDEITINLSNPEEVKAFNEIVMDKLYKKVIQKLIEDETIDLEDDTDLLEKLSKTFKEFKEDWHKENDKPLTNEKDIHILTTKLFLKLQEPLLISNLSKSFKVNITTNNTNNFDNEIDYSIPDISIYGEPEISKEVSQKVEHLQSIINNIENINETVDFSNNEDKNYKIDYKNELNERQLQAVKTIENPLLIIAGAGTGKTKTLSYRVSYIIENGINPENILLLTFTRKASKEMIDRIKTLLKLDKLHIQGGTFHSFANIILRQYSKLININPKFTIIDTIDSADVIDLIRRELHLEKIGNKATPKKTTVQKIISKSRNCRMSIKEVIKKEYIGWEDYIEYIETLNKHYIEYNRQHSIYDYDDLLDILSEKLKTNEKFREILQNKYQYILVDEFQDTNIIQKEIIDLIAEKNKNIMVVGDDSQSIYSFRGANYENILRFPETYPNCKIIKLEKNYRSKQNILDFSNDIVNNFKLGYKKQLYSDNKTEGVPIVKRFYDQQREAEWITEEIIRLHEKNISLNNIAVLFRNGYHSNILQASLMSKMVNFIIFGGIKFAEKKQVKDMLAYLKIILNPYDTVSWNRILNLIENIGVVTASKIVQEIENNKGIINFDSFKSKKFYKDLEKLKETLNSNIDDNISVVKKLKNLKNYYSPVLQKLESDYETRLLDVDVLITLATEYGNDVERYLNDFALEPPSNMVQQNTTPLIGELSDETLTLSTIHSSKGLEWDYVFIINMLDGLFPMDKNIGNIEALDEERRLFYVACTRAKSQLYITMPSVLSNYGDSFFSQPSRFIAEIKKDNYNYSLGKEMDDIENNTYITTFKLTN